MQKATLTLFVILVAVVSNAQIYIGHTEQEIQFRVKHTEILTRYVMPDGAVSLALEYKENAAYVRRYYIDKGTGRCFLYVLQPKSQEALDTFIKFCNDNYDETAKDNEWVTNICLGYYQGHCVDDVNVRVQLRTVKSTGTRMFYFVPVAELKG